MWGVYCELSQKLRFLNPPFNRANEEVPEDYLELGLPLTLPSPHRQHDHLAKGRGFPE